MQGYYFLVVALLLTFYCVVSYSFMKLDSYDKIVLNTNWVLNNLIHPIIIISKIITPHWGVEWIYRSNNENVSKKTCIFFAQKNTKQLKTIKKILFSKKVSDFSLKSIRN